MYFLFLGGHSSGNPAAAVGRGAGLRLRWALPPPGNHGQPPASSDHPLLGVIRFFVLQSLDEPLSSLCKDIGRAKSYHLTENLSGGGKNIGGRGRWRIGRNLGRPERLFGPPLLTGPGWAGWNISARFLAIGRWGEGGGASLLRHCGNPASVFAARSRPRGTPVNRAQWRVGGRDGAARGGRHRGGHPRPRRREGAGAPSP